MRIFVRGAKGQVAASAAALGKSAYGRHLLQIAEIEGDVLKAS